MNFPVGHEVLDDYPCTWKGVIDQKPMVGDLEKFGEHVLSTFWKFFQAEVHLFILHCLFILPLFRSCNNVALFSLVPFGKGDSGPSSD